MKEEKSKVTVEILKLARLVIVLAAAAGIAVFLYVRYRDASEPELTSSFVNGKLEAVSDLTVSKLTYTGLIRYSDGKIPFLTKNSFSMMYTANVRAGIDLSKARIEIAEDQVVITLPECTVQSVDVDPDSIEFYDEQWALFNWTEKTDVIDTVAAARDDVSQKADLESLLDAARIQTESVIRGLLEDAVGERELVVQ